MTNKKMIKRAFTLPELIGVIAILAVVISIALSLVIGIRSSILEQDYKNIIGLLEIEATNYAEDTGITTVTVENLIQNGYVMPDDETDIYNPVNNESLNCHLITSVFDNGSYVSTFGEDIGRAENGTCNSYVSTVDLVICKYDANFNTCEIIDSTAEDGSDIWFGENINLGIRYRNGDTLKDESLTYYWSSTEGTTGSDFYISTNTNLISQSIYTARVTFPDSTVSEISQAINIDLQDPVVIDSTIENIDSTSTNSEWSRGKRAIITASDYSGSGVAGIYAGNVTDCTENLPYVAVDAKNMATINLAENLNTVCVIDKAGNVSDSSYTINNDRVDSTGADWINLISSNPTTYTRSLKIIGTAQDSKSGLVAYQFTTSNNYNNSSWINISKTNNTITQEKTIDSNGIYYFWVKDEIGNISSQSIVVNNIDRVINNINVTKSTNNYVTELTLTATATDTQAGIVRYAWSRSASQPTTSSWTNISNTSRVTSTYNVSQSTGNGNYYFWVADAAGNVDYYSISVDEIVWQYSETIRKYSESTSSISDDINISNMKMFDYAVVDNGRISTDVVGTRIYYTVRGGDTHWDSRLVEHTTRAEDYPAYSYEGDCESWYCDRGGYPDGRGYCTGDSYTALGKTFTSICTCTGGRYSCNSEGASSTCPEGYVRPNGSWGKCYYRPDYNGQSCSGNLEKYSTTQCEFQCDWDRDYPAECEEYEIEYECNRGDYLDGRYCYTCDRGTLNRYDMTCTYSEYEDYTYWEYYITIYYYA